MRKVKMESSRVRLKKDAGKKVVTGVTNLFFKGAGKITHGILHFFSKHGCNWIVNSVQYLGPTNP